MVERGEYRLGICGGYLATPRGESQVIGVSSATQVSSRVAMIKGLVMGRLKIGRAVNTPEERERIREEKLNRHNLESFIRTRHPTLSNFHLKHQTRGPRIMLR
jgi:hypothetical protein